MKNFAANKEYLNAGNLLEAVNGLDQHFGNYLHNERIAKIHESFKLIRQTFTDQVYGEFGKYVHLYHFSNFLRFLENPSDPSQNTQALADACFVIEALGKDAK